MRKKVILLVLSILVVLAIAVPRIPWISAGLREIVVPEMEEATGKKVSIEKISLNLFPLFIEAKGVRVYDEGGALVDAKRVKGYIDIGGIFGRRISIHRLALFEPAVNIERVKLEDVIRHVRAYLEKEKKPAFKVKINVVEVIKGRIFFRDEAAKSSVELRELSGEFITGEKQRLVVQIKGFGLEKEGWPKIVSDIEAAAVLKEDELEVKRLEIESFGSKLTGEGTYSRGKGTLKTNLALIVDSVKRLLNLKERGEGRISVKGEIRMGSEERKKEGGKGISLPDLRTVVLDLKVSGELYIQTLMELLKVKDRIEGFVNLQGEISGPLSDIKGKAKARLQKGNLYGVDIDSLTCDILYADKVMQFENGSAFLYNGKGRAEAAIHLPVVDFYSLHVRVESV
ncbi:MAG: hypothetical protein AB1442_15045, partial [Nitrospirota bacterium]